MADENVEGTLSVGFDGSAIDQGMQKTADKVEKQAQRIAKAAKKAADDTAKSLAQATNITPKSSPAPKSPTQRVGLDGMTYAERQQFWVQQRESRREAKEQSRVERETRFSSGRERKAQEVSERRSRYEAQQAIWAENRAKAAVDKQLRKEQRQAASTAAREKREADVTQRRQEREARVTANRESRAEAAAQRRQERETRIATNREIKEQALFIRRQERETILANNRLERESAQQRKVMRREDVRDAAAVQRVVNRSLAAPSDVQAKVLSTLTGPGASLARQGMRNVGATQQQAVIAQLGAAGFNTQAANFLGGAGGRRPPTLGGNVAAGGAGGGPQGVSGWFQRNARSLISGFAGGLGFGVAGFGAQAVGQAARAVVEATQEATAYDRQRVAAEQLAGSQAKLNDLLDAYTEASGGAVDKTTTLSNVTRLLATGYADSVPDVERFVRATRGASIALGKPQDFVIQETQLAISNTSQKRLDQIGLSIQEVTDRIGDLRKTNKDWSRETAFNEAVLGIMEEKYGSLTNTLEGQATGLERLTKAWADLRLQMGQSAQGPVNSIAGALASAITNANTAAQQQSDIRTKAMADPNFRPAIGATELEKDTYATVRASQESEKVIKDIWGAVSDFVIENIYGIKLDKNPGPSFSAPVPSWMTSASGKAMPGPEVPDWRKYQEDAQDIIEQSYDTQNDIIEQANKARIQEIEQYEEQRANLIRDYGKQMTREEEDFLRQRARGLRDYNRSVAEVGEDALEREEEMREDLDEKIADARGDTAKRVAKIEEKYNEDREKAERKHRDNLLKAAGQLDAIAVLEERKRWREENSDRKDAHDEQIEETKEALQEQIDEAREAYEERLKDAREADEKRLEDMREAREQQLADEDEDRGIQLGRAQKDHDDQLAELDRQHGLRMEQIEKESQEQLTALEDALAKDLNAVGVYVAGYLEKIADRDKAIDHWFQRVMDRVEGKIAEENEIPGGKSLRDEIMGQAGMRYGTENAPAVFSNPAVTYQNGSNRSTVFNAGAIVVYTTPGMEERVGELVEEKIIELLDKVE